MNEEHPVYRCDKCRSFVSFSDQQGRCRRMPPIYCGDYNESHIFNDSAYFDWPITKASDWCNEYSKKPKGYISDDD